MPLTEKELQQIKKEALKKFPVTPEKVGLVTIDSYEPMRLVYTATVTTERERAKVLAIDFNKWCNDELWKHEHAEQRTFTDDEKYFYFINQYNQ